MKRVYIAGCGGMLGEAFYRTFRDFELRCTDISVDEPWLSYCDIRDLGAYARDVAEFKPDYLFHLGAHTDLEFCELNPDDAYRTNTMAAENAVYVVKALGIPLVYISTAGIFDGSKNGFDDWDLPNPLGHYARSKYAGERFVVENAWPHLVCRAGWMMGGGPRKDKKFVNKIMKQLKAGKRELFIVNDKLGTPTFTDDFANNVRALVHAELWGLYNMVCQGETSRVEVAREICSILRLDEEIRITEVSSDHFKAEYFAPRPSSERLVNRKLKLREMDLMRDWKTALREYLARDYSGYL